MQALKLNKIIIYNKLDIFNSAWLRAANFSALIGQHFTIVREDGWKKG